MIDRLRNRLRRGALDDTGAILVLAIIIVTVVALVTGLVLTRGEGSLRATIKLREVAGTTYAADGAAQVVLNGLRTGHWDGDVPKPANWVFTNEEGDGCFGRNEVGVVTEDEELLLSNFYPATKSSGDGPTSAYVKCVPEVATGAQGTVRHVSNANSPGDAIIMLGNSATEIGLSNANKILRIRGGVRVNSTIGGGGQFEVNDANVSARTGTCNNVVISPGFNRSCPAGSGPTDPNYPADIVSIPELRSVPTCTGGAYVELLPGYYDDAKALSDLTDNCNRVIWFRSGAYYFDFHNSSSNGDPLYNSGITGAGSNNVWTISNTRVVGGELIGGGVPTAGTPVPGACQNPIDDPGAQGVQFIFGGDSRLMFGAGGIVELCATYRANRPPIVVYGNKVGDNPSLMTLSGAADSLKPSAAPTVAAQTGSDGTFTPLTSAALQDDGNGIVTWQRGASAGGSPETRTLRITGFEPDAAIPRGAVLRDARLVARTKAASIANNVAAPTVTMTPNGGVALPAVTLNKNTALTTDTINLKDASTVAVYNALAKRIHDHGYTGMSVDFLATSRAATPGQSVQLDKMWLELDYYIPQMRGPAAIPTNCTTRIGTGACSFIDSVPNGQGEPYFQGTTYAPLSEVALNMKNTAAQVFRWGLIARALHVNINGAFTYDGIVINLPDNSPGLGLNGTLVQFDVHVCPNSATCDDTGKLALKVRAQIWDRDADASTTDDREITVLSWSHQR